jgi:glycosyltransferase involved in cell wall biosynthesis
MGVDKMEVTFFYDIKFLVKDSKIFSHYGVNNSMFDRYLSIFDHFTYVGRLEEIDKNNRMYLNDRYEVTNISVITYKNFHNDIFKVVKQAVADSEFCICRLPSIAGAIACYESEKQGKNYVVEVVGNAFEALWFHSMKSKIFALPFHVLMKHTIKKAPFVAYITENYLQSIYPTKGLTCGGIANVSLPKSDDAILERRINKIKKRKEKEPIHIGLIGSLDVNYKGHDTAMKAISVLKDWYPNIKLHFLGQGSKERWVQLAKELEVDEYVSYDGSLPGGKPVFDWLDTMDIYIQPSLTEGHGRGAVEAMSRGCITFASRIGGLVDSIEQKYLFSKQDYRTLAHYIENVINDKDFAIEAVKSSFEKSKKYEEERIEDKRRKFYWIAVQNWNDNNS